jgi:restriction system protein
LRRQSTKETALQFKVPEKSLFALLLRSPWWVSLIAAAGIFLIARLVLPDRFALYSVITGSPFLLVGLYVAWKQLRTPSSARIAASLDAIRAMSWSDFSAAIEEIYRRDGYTVKHFKGAAADFAMEREGYTTLVSCKRWKAAGHGVEALRDLESARVKQDAREAVYVAAGEITDNARLFAAEKDIRVVQGAELAQWLRGKGAAKRIAAK